MVHVQIRVSEEFREKITEKLRKLKPEPPLQAVVEGLLQQWLDGDLPSPAPPDPYAHEIAMLRNILDEGTTEQKRTVRGMLAGYSELARQASETLKSHSRKRPSS